MSKCKLYVCGAHLIGETEDVFRIFEAMNAANLELLEYDYVPRSDSPTGESQSMYFTKPLNDKLKIEGIDPEDYAVWKLYTSTRKDKK